MLPPVPESLRADTAAFEIVPPELLARPPRDEVRRLDRDACALLLDQYLRRLASQETRGRRALGTIAAEFLRRQAHHALGFARVDDYARERLGVSARELQTCARVVSALSALPVLSVAFERGALSWTQVRLLVAVARTETEQVWLAIADGRTVRALEAIIRDANARARVHEGAVAPPTTAGTAPATDAADPTDPVPATDAAHSLTETLEDCAEDSPLTDGEPSVTLRMRCPRWVAPLWRASLEMARRVAGEPLPTWRAAEAIAAEGLAALWTLEPSARETDHVLAQLADRRGPVLDPGEARATFHAAAVETIDWSAVVEALPEDVERLARNVAACDAHALDARLGAAMHALRRIDWQLGRLLRLFVDCRLYELFGFDSSSRYLREQLGLEVRKARLLVALERKTWQSPALTEACRSGTLSALRALTIAPVLGGGTAEAWVQRATEVTLRRLADEVGWALDVRDAGASCVPMAPPAHGAALDAPPRQMRAPLDETLSAEIVVRGPVSVIALFRTAVAAFHAPLTPAWTGLVNLLAHVNAEWARLPHHHDPVFVRDGWRCAAPACSSRRHLHDHHIPFRSRGGNNARDNRITLCAWHHLRGIHGGRVRAWGAAPAAVHWELGVRRGGPPLLCLVGERYEEVQRGAPIM
ncbi:MAG: HNH endonuclease [Deltaproteobacteria bacterium]|nr:HNH endonuclease [Deltaproteobacteria bacterium]